MGANPHANGGILLKDLRMPDFRNYAVAVPKAGVAVAEATRIMGQFLRDIMKLNMAHRNFRVFGPDETASNRLTALFEVTDRTWVADTMPDGWKLWLDWHRLVAPDNAVEIKALEADRGSYLGYVRLVARRQGGTILADHIESVPAQYTKTPLLRS